MGFLDRLFGRQPQQNAQQPYAAPSPGSPYPPQDLPATVAVPQDAPPTVAEDERAVARYRYLLRTAPPEKVEEAHAEAFARLSPQQRQQVLAQLSTDLPEAERPRSDDPRDLARAATRAEVQQPGFLQRSFGMGGGMGGVGMGGMGMGGMIAGSMLGTIAGVVIGSAVADSLFGGYEQSPEAAQAGDVSGDTAGDAEAADGGDQSGQGDPTGADTGGTDYGNAADGQYSGTDADYSGADAGSADVGGGDFFGGGDFGSGNDFGGDFGGGDF